MPELHSPLAILLLSLAAGAIRVSTPYLFVSLGECLTEKAGRVNLGLEGVLVSGAMAGYATACLSGSPWLGVLAAAGAGLLLGALHGLVCSLPRVSDIAFGIALMLLGTGLAFFLGKPFIEPQAPMLGSLDLGRWAAGLPQLHNTLRISPLFLLGIVLALALQWGLRHTRWGMVLRLVGDHAETARALGYHGTRVRIAATSVGGALAAVGGAYLSLVYPGSWNEGLSSGQGLMAVALVIFARWQPLRCLAASLLFGAAGALGPALQAIGETAGYDLWNAAPYVLTLAIMILHCRPDRRFAGAPGELSLTR
ncbi:ABC transporter permease [Burkholderia gladioli]|uniref:ABC transporter permease n=1 Tax=Burkholderia gladioli TaxID=28095 RepID=UPI000BBD3AA7|nr:ABC transporter permease [Burkholderia gladioli]ATF83735.1 ABC transporter permease [Burkholderia gladioli pv. gladioli]MBJ9712698.1 ABC transporter permease [Burkholderia gladioli]MBU9154659.1 ABC transporter permease [Burkholderia gladioli]MDR8090783.1 ABC transporter permease [Burkholderia gladioli]MDZ4040443.1 ABC transporter permease [Burkholderia gladioli pv. alliicola]